MLLEQKPRRRPSLRLSHPDSARLLQNIRGYLPDTRYSRTKRLAEIFGCDLRTARRILNTPAGKLPRLRRVYLMHAVKYTGVPAIGLTGRTVAGPEIKRYMRLMSDRLPTLDRFKALTALAASMTAHCMYSYALPASFTVDSSENGEPFALRIDIRRQSVLNPMLAMEPHSIIVDKAKDNKWQLRYVHPRQGNRFTGHLTDVNFERMLQHIQST